jgi:hypothetical protein
LVSWRAAVVVRWSDGNEVDGLTWHSDDVLICEGDLIDRRHVGVVEHHNHERDAILDGDLL